MPIFVLLWEERTDVSIKKIGTFLLLGLMIISMLVCFFMVFSAHGATTGIDEKKMVSTAPQVR